MTVKKPSSKKKDTLLSKLAGTLGGLVFVALGVYTMLESTAFHPADAEESARAKTRLFTNAMRWLIDTIGSVPAGLLLAAAGAFIVYVVWAKPKPANGATPTAPHA